MSRLGPEQVRHVARLAALRLADEEVAALRADLDAVLDYVALLDQVDTEGVEPTAHVIPFETPLRPDEPAAPLDPEEILSAAPAREGTAFAVPKVLEEG
jgi:aspartyl-tRNA(Asn)/glutamyl-tRNA(Gln) amidotransferase subunit C